MAEVKFTIVGDPSNLRVSQCTYCANRSPDGTRCKAFPRGIPVELLYNEHDHRAEFPGDQGIRYQPIVLGKVVRPAVKPSPQVAARAKAEVKPKIEAQPQIESHDEFELDLAAIQ